MSQVSGVNQSYYLPDKKVAQPKGLHDPETFLKILVAQLKYQDPMEPQDSATFINQLTQMASMEQMMSMGKNMEKMAEKYETARYFDLIGQEVSLVEGNELVTGTVGGVVFDQQQPYFYLDHDPQGNIYTMDQVVTVTGKNTAGGDLLPYLSLVGMAVKILDGQQQITGPVEKVLLQQGQVAVEVDGALYGAEQIIEISALPPAPVPTPVEEHTSPPEETQPEPDLEPEPTIEA